MGVTVPACLLASPLLAGAAAPRRPASRPVPGLVEQPLAPRSGPRGQTMFVALAPDATGVRAENKFDDPAIWGRLYREFEIGAIGTGVAIGDYDGDGRPDIFVVSKTESCHLFRNLGDLHFEDVTVKAGVGDNDTAARIWKQGAALADVNNDGRLDLYVCRFNAPNLLYVNQGDGTFKEMAHAAGLDVTDACAMAAFCDYDRDGWLDVFIQTNVLDASANPEGQRDYLFHNSGDGTFTNVSEKSGVAPGPTHGNSAMWWDYDNDGWPDLYVANDFAGPDALYRNQRDGTFTDVIATVVPHVPFSSMGSDLGDINNDGRIDFMAADMASTTHEGDQRTLAETRARLKDLPDDSSTVPQYPRNAIFLNTGTGRCLEVADLAGLDATDWTWSLRWEDLDNDGRLDLYVATGMYREIHNADLIGQRMAAQSEQMRMQVVRAKPVFAEPNHAWRNLGDLHFTNVAPDWGLDHKGVSFAAAFGDLDGDGDLDLVTSNYQAGPTLLRNDSDAGHRVIVALRGTRSNRFGVGAVVRLKSATGEQVRELTLARGYMASSEPVLHFGLGDVARIDQLKVTWPSGQEQTFANLPADQRFVITEPAAPTSRPTTAPETPPAPQFTDVSETANLAWPSHEEMYDEFLDQRLLPRRFNRRGPALAVADIDGQGNESVCIGGTTRDPLRVLTSTSAMHFDIAAGAVPASDATVDDGPLLFLDANADGHQDLFVTRGGAAEPEGSDAYQPRLLLNDGTGAFRVAPDGMLPPLSISAGAVVAADFEHDGRLDVFIGGRVAPGEYPRTPQSALLVNRGGNFEDATDQLAPGLHKIGMVTAALATDVDADGWPDLLHRARVGSGEILSQRSGKVVHGPNRSRGFCGRRHRLVDVPRRGRLQRRRPARLRGGQRRAQHAIPG